MATTKWTRVVKFNGSWSTGNQFFNLAALSTGQTLLRSRFAWGFGGTTHPSVVASQVMTNPMAFGIATTVGPTLSYAPPDVISASSDFNPPAERWLWWEARVPTVTAWDSAGNVVTWQSNTAAEETDSHGMVKAPVMPGGSSLNVSAVFRAENAWDASGAATFWCFASLLVRTP